MLDQIDGSLGFLELHPDFCPGYRGVVGVVPWVSFWWGETVEKGWGLRVKKSLGMIVTCINVLKKSDRLKHFIPVWNSRMIMFKGKKCARNVDSQESYFWRFDTGFPGHSGYFLGKIRGQKLAQLLLLGSLMEPFRCPQFHVHWGNIERKSSDVTDSYPFGRKVKLELQVWFRVGWSNKEMSKIFYRYSHITSTPPPPPKKKKTSRISPKNRYQSKNGKWHVIFQPSFFRVIYVS